MSFPSRVARHAKRNAYGLIAVFIALGGTAVALPGKNSVDSGDIKNRQVRSADLAKDAATTAKLKRSAVTSAKVADAAGPKGLRKADLGAVLWQGLIDPPAIDDGSCVDVDVDVPGAEPGDLVVANPAVPLFANDVGLAAYPLSVSEADVVAFKFCNFTADGINGGQKDWQILLIR